MISREPLGFSCPVDPSGVASTPRFSCPSGRVASVYSDPDAGCPSSLSQAEQLRLFEVCPPGHKLELRDVVASHRGGGLWWVVFVDGSLVEYHMSDLEVAARLYFSVIVDRVAQEDSGKVGPQAENVVQLSETLTVPARFVGKPSGGGFCFFPHLPRNFGVLSPLHFPESPAASVADWESEETPAPIAAGAGDTFLAAEPQQKGNH